MEPKYSSQYIDRLLEGSTFHDLVEISALIWSSPEIRRELPDYGLSTFEFLFVQTLTWFAQALRSGVWTYYEATPVTRQRAMARALRMHGPAGFAEWYERGMACWQDTEKIREVDLWIEENDDLANKWLARLAKENRDALLAIS